MITTNIKKEETTPKKISIKKKVLIEDLYEDGNIKTEKDKLAQNKSIMRALSDQDKYFDIKQIIANKDRLPTLYQSLSGHTQIKWNESLINYIGRYIRMHGIPTGMNEKVDEFVLYLKSEKKRIKGTFADVVVSKPERDFNAIYTAKGVSYRNKIYAKIKMDKYPVSDVIFSNTKLKNYSPEDTYINIKTKKWIINEKRHIEINLTDEFISDISSNNFTWLANNANDNKVSSAVISNGINRIYASMN
jgi:hypothetical protein